MLQDMLQVLQDIVNWFKGAWLSFQVSQNARRLMLLRRLAHDRDPATLASEPVTLETYCNVVSHFLNTHPDIDSQIWSLEQAKKLFQHTRTLIDIGELCLYGPD